MSFAGPPDPALHRSLEAAHKKGIVLVAAAGNAGPKSPPLYPAADPNVIAVTATDADDKLFAQSNRGRHIAVAAPGAQILVAIPDGSYEVSSGTSYSAAEVSGIVALMLERKGDLTPDKVRDILLATAKDLGPKGPRHHVRRRTCSLRLGATGLPRIYRGCPRQGQGDPGESGDRRSGRAVRPG